MTEKYRRPITFELEKRLQEPVRRLIVVAGPRQVGKTTAVHQVLQSGRPPETFRFLAVDAPGEAADPLDFSASDSSVTLSPLQGNPQWLVNQWRAAREAAWKWHHHQRTSVSVQAPSEGEPPAPLPYVLVFDEIQKIPDWSSMVKGLWDEDRRLDMPLHVVVLGSAPLLMQHGLSESLMGRFELLQMSHWSYQEMHDCFGFNLDQYVYFGGYPGPADMVLKGDESRWRGEVIGSLIAPNLKKDVLALARIEKPAVLEQLFKLGCQYSGQIVAVSKLLVQLEDAGNTTTLSHYLSLLQAAGLLAGLEKFAAQAIRQRAAPPKLNALNTAFLSVYSEKSFKQARADSTFWGHLVETCVGAHLINTAESNVHVRYWRESPHEVDFVLQQGGRICALEVKSATHDQSARKGLRFFAEKHASLDVSTAVLGGDDDALIEALTHTASHWLNRVDHAKR